jgi:hypothetical protein
MYNSHSHAQAVGGAAVAYESAALDDRDSTHIVDALEEGQ